MAAPTVLGAGSATSSATTTSVTITKATGTVDGALLLAVVVNGGANAAPSTVPTDWTLHDSAGGTTWWGGVYLKNAGASEPANYTWSGFTDSCTGCMIAISGHDTGDPVDVSASQANTNMHVLCPGVTTTVADTLIVGAAAVDDNQTIGTWACATDPTTLTEQVEQLSSGGLDTGSGIATATKASAGATGNLTATLGGTRDHSAFLIAIKPAGGGGPSEVTLTPATVHVSAVAVTPEPQPVTVALTPATVHASAVAVTPVPQPVTVALTPATVHVSAVATTPVPQPVTVALTPATVHINAVPLGTGAGPSEVTLTPATVHVNAVAVTPVPQPVTVALTPATVHVTAPPVTPTPGPVTVVLTPATVHVTAVPVVASPAPGAVTLTPATVHVTAVAVTAVPGLVTITLTPAIVHVTAVALGVLSSDMVVGLDVSGLVGTSLDGGAVNTGRYESRTAGTYYD